MTASRFKSMLLVLSAGALWTACHVGLPPEPPGADPTAANAAVTPYQAPPNPYESSAFAGEPTPTAEDHSDHSKMDHSKMDHSKMDHSKMDHSKMDPSKMDQKPPEPPR